MSVYQGNLDGFLRYVGPMMRNVVCNLARSHKKGRSCQGKKEDGSKCNKRTELEAAHLVGHERPAIIRELLSPYREESKDHYTVDLADFEKNFRQKHENLDDIIQLMCRPCHRKYDKAHGIKSITTISIDDLLNPEEEAVLEQNEIVAIKESFKLYESDKAKVLARVKQKYPAINSQNSSYARISEANGKWNFDVDPKKFNQDFYFIFYDQVNDVFKIALIPVSNLNIKANATKGNGYVRFLIDENFIETGKNDFNKYLFEK